MTKNLSITKKNLANTIIDKVGISSVDAKKLVDNFFQTIIQGIQEDHIVKISRFGTFKTSEKKERLGRNPKNREDVIINSRKVVTFKASDVVKNKINKK